MDVYGFQGGAKTSLERMLAWAANDKQPSGGTLGDWIFTREVVQYEPVPEPSEITMSLSSNAEQRHWRTPSEFRACPQEYAGNPLAAYAENLKPDVPFCQNHLYSTVVSKSTLAENGQAIFVISFGENEIKRYGLAQITFEDGLFIHTSLRTYFSPEGAEKEYTLAQGLEWTGGDSIDDYC